jgi:hypothetical protein
MWSEINERLMQAKERVRSGRKLEAMLRETRQILHDEQNKCSMMRQRLESEESDVNKLEGLSLTGLFHSVLGTKEQRLEKEKREYLAAKLKYDESVQAVEETREEEQSLQYELATFANVDAEFDILIQEKEMLLVGAADDKAEKLVALSESLADLTCDRKELGEAIQAGEAALGSLQQVSSDLGSASNWGTWDMLGGGIIATMAKHSKIDSAKQHAHEAQRQLRRFREELADSGQRLNVSLEIGGFSKFADYFFDGLIADWVVQSKIQQGSSACSTAIASVNAAVNACRSRLAETQRDIDSVSKSRLDFIEQR